MRHQLHALPNPYWCARPATRAPAPRLGEPLRSLTAARARQGALQVPRPQRRRRPRPRRRHKPSAPAAAGGGRGRRGARRARPRPVLGGAGVPGRARVHRPQAPPSVQAFPHPASAQPAHRQPRRRAGLRREVTRWLNSDVVREALHAAPRHVTGDFEECSSRLQYTSTYGSMVPVHKHLLQQGARLRARPAEPCSSTRAGVPHGAQASSGAMRVVDRAAGAGLQRRLRPRDPPPWHRALDAQPGAARARRPALAAAQLCAPCCCRPSSQHAPRPGSSAETGGAWPQVAGHVQEYEGDFAFATVLGAGHEVPQTNPVEALALFESFIAGRSL